MGEAENFVHPTGSSRSCSSYELQQQSMKRSARRKYGRCHFWFTTKSWKPSAEQMDQDHSSSDSWNNNDAAASLENSASSDEEDIGSETRAIYSIVLKLPGHSTILNSTKLPSSDNLQVPEEDIQFFETPWNAACQAPRSMGLSRQEYWSGFPFPSPWDHPDPGIRLGQNICHLFEIPAFVRCAARSSQLRH